MCVCEQVGDFIRQIVDERSEAARCGDTGVFGQIEPTSPDEYEAAADERTALDLMQGEFQCVFEGCTRPTYINLITA